MTLDKGQDGMGRRRTGIIVYGHSRPVLLRNVLESLRRQGVVKDIHVWLDGHAQRTGLLGPVNQCRQMLKEQFPQVHLTAINGNIGIEKLMLDGLSFMSSRYDRTIVLEDDCFPTACAIEEFKKALDEIEKRPDVYSVYGHHFLTESEGETITRFQGWGWATTREKLLPMLAEMKQCFAMSEPEYLRWVRKNLTPEVVRRLDVTPGRNCVPVIASHFCWDGCTCLVTAMRGLVHKRTAKRVIYNCGMGEGSTHFAENDRLGWPPFNMIRPAEVWDYYDDTSQQRAKRCEGGRVVYSRPTVVGSKDQEPRAGEIVVDGFRFKDVQRTKHQNNSVGFNDRYVIKIEHEKHPRKLRDLSQEIEIIKYLNSRGCVSCPKLVSQGRLKSGERYFIQQRIHNAREFNVADMVFSILEQKNFGVCEGDLKKENFIFDRDGVCYIIDYDQAFCNQRFISMGNIEYLEGFAQYMVNRWRNYGLTDFYKWGGYNKDEIFSLFSNGSFNLAATTIFKEQVTTHTQSGIYHSLNTDKLYIEGARDLNPRQDALNTVRFKKGETVLDVGCNMGLLGHYLHDRGCSVTGIDMDPKIIIGAKMVANILGKNIRFEWLDVDEGGIEQQYDTICLFSVIHHVKNFRQVTENIAQKCSRIILECALKEHGFKPIQGTWTGTSRWEFNSVQELTRYLETVFTGFRLSKYHGSVDRNRHIMTFVKEPAAIGAQVRSELPVKVQQGESVAAERTHESKYLVSAIVSTYNSERFIRGCLEDLENQTIADKLEIIVVNSGSQQNEEAIVKEFQQKYDNIKYIKTQQRETVYQAWNRAIKAASGKYITNANTDDRHTRDTLEKMAEALEENPEKALVYGNQWNVEEIDGERIIVGERINGEFSRSRLFSGECPPGSQPMWRKDVHDVFGYFDKAFFVSGDYEFWFRLTQKFDFLYLNELLGERLIGTELVSGANKELLAFENMLIHKCYNYALQTSTMIAHRAISDNPVFSTWPEVQLWKEKVQAKLHSSSVSLDQYITKTQDLRKPGRPRLSIVVVAYNRASQLEDNLRSLKEQTEQDFELILVSNGSGSPDLQKLSEQFKNGFCYVEISRNFGPSFARNVAVTRTKADYIAFLDDDAIAEKDFVRNVISHFKNHDICGLRGKILPKSRRTAEDGPACYDLGDEVIFTACEPSSHSAYRKEALLKVGGFDQDLFGYEGAELSYRIHKSQNERFNCIIYFPDVVVFHNSRERFEQSVEKNLRKAAASKLARRKWPEIEGYLQLIRSFYPANKESVEKDYSRLLSNSLYLQERYPREAIKWAQKAAQLEPLVVKSCFVLGSLYTQLKMFDKAVPLLERTLTLLSGDLHEFYMDNPQAGRENWSNTAECYISAATKLSQCFMQSQEYGKMKTIYSHLLSNPHLQLTPAQRRNFESVLAKFQNVQAVAIGDGMEGVPAEAFEKDAARGISGTDGARSSDVSDAQMNEQYLVSAIVSTYNSERFLRACLDDLQQQTIADKLQIIVVNSGSEQNEEAIVREYQQRYNNIVYIKTEQRETVYAAWNRAVKVAQGTFLTNANTDDRHRADALEIMTGTLLANPNVALVYSDQIFTETGNATFDNPHATDMHKWPDYSRQRLLLGCCVGSQPMWRKHMHEEFGYFDETLTCAGDWDFWLRISSEHKFKHISEFLGLYYHNKEGLEHGQKIHSLYERYLVGKRYGTEYIATIPFYKGRDLPLVSVIMPAYNAGDYIAEAIESVLIQSYRNFELIVVDDGSTDRTKDIVSSFKDEKVKYVYKDNGGASSARNSGIKQSKGNFIIFLDSDDMMQTEYIVNHLKEFQKHPDAELIYCDHGLIDPDGKPIRVIEQLEYADRKQLVKDMFRCGYPIIQPRGCFRRAVIDKIGNYDEQLPVAEDYDLMRRFLKAGLKIHHLKGAMYLRRMHPDSLCKTNTMEKAKAHISVIKRIIDTFSPDELFPDIDWSRIPQDKIAQHAGCLIGATLIAIAKNYQTTNEPINAGLALQQARTALNECLKIDPGHSQARGLLRDCELLCRALSRTGPAFSEAGKPDGSKAVSVS